MLQKKEVILGETLIEWSYFEGEFDNEIKLITERGTELTIQELEGPAVLEAVQFATKAGIRHLLPWFIEAIEHCIDSDDKMIIAEIAVSRLSVPQKENPADFELPDWMKTIDKWYLPFGDEPYMDEEQVALQDKWVVELASFLDAQSCKVVHDTLVKVFDYSEPHTFPYLYVHNQYGINEARTLEIWKRASER